MDRDDFWTTVRNKGETGSGSGAIRAALVFGAIVIAAALIVTPLLGSREDRMFAQRSHNDFDTLTTGSIGPAPMRTYTVRRSITQPMPDALCIIDSAGARHGAC